MQWESRAPLPKDLQRLVAAWPNLPKAIKAAIAAMLQATGA
jgi:hypothetical protein